MKTLSFLLEQQNTPAGVNAFCILKPGFTKYEDEFFTLLKTNDWKVVDKVKKTLTKDEACKLYESKKDEAFYNALCEYMSSDECICCSCSKKCDNPIKEMSSLKEKVRKAWGEDDMKNAMHSSDSLDNVARESKLCIQGICEAAEEDLFDADTTDMLVDLLQKALSEEFLAWYQYTIIKPYLIGPFRTEVAELLETNAKDELEDHAYWIMDRISQLGRIPMDLMHINSLNKIAPHKYIEPSTVDIEVILNELVQAEDGAIETYREIIEKTKDIDPVTHRKMIQILNDEEEHRTDLLDFLADIKQTKNAI